MFKTQNFCHIASNNRNNVKVGVFVYRTTDDLATVTTSGYFNGRIIDINLHDLIIHEQVDTADQTKVQRNLLCVTQRTLENVGTAVIKSKWEGDIEQDIADIEQEIAGLDNRFVKLDGTSVMTGPLLMRATDDFKCAIAPYWDGIGFFKLNDNNSVTLMASIEYNSGFEPATNNTYNIGANARKWKNLYLSGSAYITKINNGYDIAVPVTNSSDTLALKSQVDLAANSGRMITDQGVWYAKMYAATVAPAAEDGTNYADFSQTDGQGNPIIVIYERQSGAWVQDQTITPPAEYDGYVPITSKIWDIAEQAGQQGGRILWNHQSKEFTPYPQIISFEDIEVTGNSTVIMPQNPSASQIVNKDYVDNKFAGDTYHPDLFDWKWADHQLNDVQWLRADTFSWQDGGVYEAAYDHLVDDIDGKTLQSETIAGTTVQFYLADDGHKICPDTQESNVAAIYAATGVAWYYILDTENQRFKLPRDNTQNQRVLIKTITSGTKWARIYADGWVEQGDTNPGTFGTVNFLITMQDTNYNINFAPTDTYHVPRITNRTTSSFSSNGRNIDNSGLTGTTSFASWEVDGYADITNVASQFDAQYKHLYFYVGNFTQSAIENTAGLNAELFNGKADLNLANVLANIDFVVERQEPTAENGYAWYRKYRSGWVEQGGTCAANYSGVAVTFPMTMNDGNYQFQLSVGQGQLTGTVGSVAYNRTTTGMTVYTNYSGGTPDYICWEVKGIAA